MKKILFLLTLLIFTGLVYADDNYQNYESPRIYGGLNKKQVYSESNIVESAKSSSVNLDVITLDEIQSQNSPVISQLLNQLGSVTTQNSGSLGDITTVRIRGVDRVRLNVDGIGFNPIRGTSSNVEIQNIFSDDIERIEVIKGPQGNIGNTNASGGVISLVTRRGYGKPKFEIESDFGNLKTFKERIAFMGAGDKVDYYLALNWLKTDGGAWTEKLGRIQNDDYNNLGVVANIGAKLLDDNAEIRNIFRMQNARKGVGVGYGYDSSWNYVTKQDPNNYSRTNNITDTLSFVHSPFEWYDYDVRMGVYNENYKYFDYDDITGIRTDSSSQYNSTGLNFNTQHNFKYKDINTLSLGYNLEGDFLNAVTDRFIASDMQNSVFVNDTINIKDILFIRGGVRYINSNRYGNYVVPNGSLALVLPTFNLKGAKTKLRASYGESVNMPTLYQRYATADYGFLQQIANPDLRAEKMKGFDVGIEQSFFDDKLSFEFGYFASKYTDYINYTYDSTWTKGWYTNTDSANLSGFEGKISYIPCDKVKLTLNYTYTKSEDESTGIELPSVPKNRINGTIYYRPHERIDLWAGAGFYSDRTYSMGNSDTLDGFVDVSLGTSIRLFSIKNLHFYLKGQFYNLLNQKMAMYKGNNDTFYNPMFNFRLGLFVKYDPDLNKKENL